MYTFKGYPSGDGWPFSFPMDTISKNKTKTRSFSLKKDERLCSKRIIDKLFTEGDAFLQYPLKIAYLKTNLPADYPVQAGFSVSKRNFKRAVARNRIKRLLRESYRLNKHLLYDELNKQQLAIFFIFIGKELPNYVQLETAIKKGLVKISKRITDQNFTANDQQN